MKINPAIFRAYDIRGIYPQDFNEKIVSQIVFSFVSLYPKIKKIVVARDARLSSPSLLKTLIKSLIEQGIDVVNLGLASDPLLSFYLHHYSLDAGLMITASHNPKDYNGLTIVFRKKGISKQDIQKIQQMVLENKNPSFFKEKGRISRPSIEQEYISYVGEKTDLKKPLRIMIDSGNGSVGYLAEKVFKNLGCGAKTIFGKPDGNFPNHLPDPYLDENLKEIKKQVKERKADLGFAFDGDGDRVTLIDNKGRRVAEDYCLLLLARAALEAQKGPVVHESRVSRMFLQRMKNLGVKTHFVQAHHGAIIEKIQQVDAVFGGEITTHYFFPKQYYLTDDAIFSALKLAEIVSQHDNFAKYIDTLPKIHVSKEIFIPVSETDKFRVIGDLKQHLKAEKYDFIDIDGARIEFKNGWALARASNTSPYIKLKFGGDSKKDFLLVKKKAMKIFKRVGIK